MSHRNILKVIERDIQRDFERRLGVPERYLTGAIGNEPMDPRDGDLEGAALLAQRAELEGARARLAADDKQLIIPGAA